MLEIRPQQLRAKFVFSLQKGGAGGGVGGLTYLEIINQKKDYFRFLTGLIVYRFCV